MPRYVARMKLSMVLSYAGGFKDAAKLVVELEKAGLDVVWVPEAYSFDAISQVGYLAAITERIEIGTAIVNVYTRTAALMAKTSKSAPPFAATRCQSTSSESICVTSTRDPVFFSKLLTASGSA